jgi:hypothetical protein
LAAVEEGGFALFQCESSSIPLEKAIWWDSHRMPDYRAFFATAAHSGTKLIYFFEKEFSQDDIDLVEDYLEMGAIADDELRLLRRRLADFRGYLGFLCRVGVGYPASEFMHWFEVYAPWFLEYVDLLEEVRDLAGGYGLEEDDEEDPPLGGYYSRN